MSVQLRVLLIILTGLFFFRIVGNVKKGKLRTDYAIGWLLSSIVLVIISIVPQIAYFFSELLGIISPANLVFSVIIFLLIILVYILFAKVSNLEEKQKNLIQELAILKDGKKQMHNYGLKKENYKSNIEEK